MANEIILESNLNEKRILYNTYWKFGNYHEIDRNSAKKLHLFK